MTEITISQQLCPDCHRPMTPMEICFHPESDYYCPSGRGSNEWISEQEELLKDELKKFKETSDFSKSLEEIESINLKLLIMTSVFILRERGEMK